MVLNWPAIILFFGPVAIALVAVIFGVCSALREIRADSQDEFQDESDDALVPVSMTPDGHVAIDIGCGMTIDPASGQIGQRIGDTSFPIGPQP